MKSLRIKTGQLAALLTSAAMLSTHPAKAIIVGPYVPDSGTLHLWQMESTTTPVTNSVAGALDLNGLGNGATLGAQSYPGFGSALSTYDGGPNNIAATDKDAYLSGAPLVNGGGDNVAMSYADPITGAFTMEAIIRVDFDPSLNYGTVASGGNGRAGFMQIITGENEGSAGRIFQFRIVPINTSSGNSTINLEFINVNEGVAPVQTISIPIPTEGDDAIASNNWYHVAVVYDGNQDTADNIRFYWTLLDPSRTNANEIGSSSMQLDLRTTASDFAIGNIGRNPPNGNFVGLIDEVRISRVPRASNGMMFSIPEPFITTEPVDQVVAVGQAVNFTAAAGGANPLTYQWRHQGTNIPGATELTYSIPSAQLSDAGEYTLMVTNDFGSVTSVVATLTVRTPLDLTWLGQSGSDWDTNLVNWDTNDDLNADAAYTPGDNVIFNDAGMFASFVNLPAPVSPSSVTVNAANDYTLTTVGGLGIIGTSRLTKNGSGTLILDVDNSYSGPSVIEGGVLQIGNAGARGSLGLGPVTNNSAIVVNRTGGVSFNSGIYGSGSLTNLTTAAISVTGENTLSGTIALNAGSLTLSGEPAQGNSTNIILTASANSAGTTSLSISGGMTFGSDVALYMLDTIVTPTDFRCGFVSVDSTNVLNGPIFVSGSGVAQFNVGGTSQLDLNGPISALGDFTGQLILRGNGPIANVTGSVNLPNANVSKTDGGVWTIHSTGNSWSNSTIASGTLRLGADNALPTGVILTMAQPNATGILDLAGFNQTIGGLRDNGGTQIIANSSETSDSLLTVTTTESWTFNGVIQDSISNGTRTVALTLNGGTLTLAGASTYSGDTTVASGTLALSGNGAINNSANIIVASGATLDAITRADATLTVNAPQTLKGNGAFNVTGNLVNQGAIELKLNKSGATLTGDTINGLNQITYGGTLKLELSGDALTTSDSFKFFNATSYAGAFENIDPATPAAGLAWDTSTLATDGTLRITDSTVNTTPTNLVVELTGNQLELSWPESHIGWRVETNAASITQADAWFELPGSATTNRVFLTIDPAQANVFYRMRLAQ